MLEWNQERIAKAMMIPAEAVKRIFCDGRIASWILEYALAEKLGLKLSRRNEYDLRAPDRSKIEVRCLTASGVYFCPSYMVGCGRTFNQEGFYEKLTNLTHFIVCDILFFPRIPYYIITSEDVRRWHEDGGILGYRSGITRIKFQNLMRRERWDREEYAP
jgi:hypothetical protein